MIQIETIQNENGKFIANIYDSNQNIRYSSHEYSKEQDAIDDVRLWVEWAEKVPTGKAASIYYILAVPETWVGPPKGAHPYSGLRMKIGRTKDIIRRWQTLRTGTSSQLIIHALEPGNSKVERKLHEKFQSDRRQGEWFACSPELTRHVFDTWAHYHILPPEHQALILQLAERIRILRATREVFGGAPDMVNPSINEPWYGKIFLDLYHKI